MHRRDRRIPARGVAWGLCVLLTVIRPCAAEAAEDPLQPIPGEEFLLPQPQVAEPVRVYCPRGYDASRAWPLVIYYPGTGGRPDTNLVRHYAGDEDYVIVGVPYTYNADVQPARGYDPEQNDTECAFLAKVIRQLSRRITIDPACILVCGVSKGGWTAAAAGERLHSQIAGWAVLAAGRPRLGLVSPPPSTLSGKPIYLGVGEHDANLYWSQRGKAFYDTQGARVILDVYPGIGHSIADDAPLLRAWFRAMGPLRLRHDLSAAQAEMRQWLSDTDDRLRATDNPGARYELLLTMSRDARVYLSGRSRQRWLQHELTRARQQSPIREEWAAEQDYYEILRNAFDIHDLDHMERVARAFEGLAARYPNTRHGAWAADRHVNTLNALEASREATRHATAQRNSTLTSRPLRVPRRTVPTVHRSSDLLRFDYGQ